MKLYTQTILAIWGWTSWHMSSMWKPPLLNLKFCSAAKILVIVAVRLDQEILSIFLPFYAERESEMVLIMLIFTLVIVLPMRFPHKHSLKHCLRLLTIIIIECSIRELVLHHTISQDIETLFRLRIYWSDGTVIRSTHYLMCKQRTIYSPDAQVCEMLVNPKHDGKKKEDKLSCACTQTILLLLKSIGRQANFLAISQSPLLRLQQKKVLHSHLRCRPWARPGTHFFVLAWVVGNSVLAFDNSHSHHFVSTPTKYISILLRNKGRHKSIKSPVMIHRN